MIERVILNAGHGLGNVRAGVYDPGAVSPYGEEHKIAESIATGVAARLPIPCVTTPQATLSQTIRWVRANAKAGDILLSLHMNAGPEKASGVEVVIANPARKEEARVFGEAFADYTFSHLRRVLVDTETPRGRVGILHTPPPAYLLEMGFVTNKDDVERVEKYGRQAVCFALLALQHYLVGQK